MKARMLSRLERLETHPGLRPPCAFHIGLLKRLPEDYVGERHVVILEREPFSSFDTVECEFEERPGPVPPGSDDGVPRVYLSEDEMKI
jgi:hypothetical protein